MKRTIVVAIIVLLAACGGKTQPGASATLRVAVATSMEPLMRDAITAYQTIAPGVSFDLIRGNGDTVTQALESGEADIGLISFLPADTSLWSAAVGSDRLAIVVNKANPIEGLSSDILRQLYQGQIAAWETPDGFQSAVTLVSREPGSAARSAFDELLLNGLPVSSTALLATSADSVPKMVADDIGAIGYVSAALANEEVRIVPVDGLMPDEPAYPLVTSIRLAAPDEPQGAGRAFLTWLLSDEGQQTIALHYTPLAR